MRIPFFPIALALLGTRAWAHDEDSPYYIQWSLGGVFSESAEGVPGAPVDFNPGYGSGLSIGRRSELSERLALDIDVETYYQYFTVDHGDLLNIPSAVDDDASMLAFMLNGTLNLKFTPEYSMYGGVGFGYAKGISYSSWDSGNLSIDDNTGLAFQGRFGFDYNLGGNYDVMLGYRYFKAEPVDIQNLSTPTVAPDELDVAQHAIEATFRWSL